MPKGVFKTERCHFFWTSVQLVSQTHFKVVLFQTNDGQAAIELSMAKDNWA
jgi:hypothetical protein